MPTEGATESGKKSIDEVIRDYLSSMKVIGEFIHNLSLL